MTTSNTPGLLTLAIACGIAYFSLTSCTGGSNPDGNVNNGDSTIVHDSSTETLSGSCNNKDRPIDELPAATLIKKEESISLINAFNAKFYGSNLNTAVFTPPGTEGLIAGDPGQRVGAFISKHMLDALFARDMSANGIMVYIGHGPAADGSTQMQYIITPAKRSHNAAPEIPAATPEGIYLKIVDENWCPINCHD